MAIVTSNRRTKFDDNGNGDAFSVPSWSKRTLSVLGTPDSGTVKLQTAVQLNEAGAEEWQDFPSASWNAEAIAVLDIPAGRYRWVLSGAGTPNLVAAMSE